MLTGNSNKERLFCHEWENTTQNQIGPTPPQTWKKNEMMPTSNHSLYIYPFIKHFINSFLMRTKSVVTWGWLDKPSQGEAKTLLHIVDIQISHPAPLRNGGLLHHSHLNARVYCDALKHDSVWNFLNSDVFHSFVREWGSMTRTTESGVVQTQSSSSLQLHQHTPINYRLISDCTCKS